MLPPSVQKKKTHCSFGFLFRMPQTEREIKLVCTDTLVQGEGFGGAAASGRTALLHTEQPEVPSLPPPGSFPCP